MSKFNDEKTIINPDEVFITGYVEDVTYPRDKKHEAGEWARVKFKIDRVLEGKLSEKAVKTDFYGNKTTILLGQMPALNSKTCYKVRCFLTEHPKYGCSYSVKMMFLHYSLDSLEEQRNFIRMVYPDGTADALLKADFDVKTAIETRNIAKLCTIKGIGEVKAEKLIKTWFYSINNAEAYAKLSKYNITLHTINKLIEKYKSPQTLVEKIEDDPYILIYEVSGIGWNKADTMVLSSGIDRLDPRRIKAYIYYYFEKIVSETGSTKCSINDLIENVSATFPELSVADIGKYIKEQIDDERLYFEKDTREIGSMKHRKIEEKIAEELVRIQRANKRPVKNIAEIIRKCEDNKKIEYSDEQKSAIYNILNENVSMLMARAGSGKSSTMYPVAMAMNFSGYSVKLAALSGKAASPFWSP